MSNGRNDTIYFRAVDAAGNASAESSAFHIMYDTQAPTVSNITSTTTPKTSTQTATLSCTDNI